MTPDSSHSDFEHATARVLLHATWILAGVTVVAAALVALDLHR